MKLVALRRIKHTHIMGGSRSNILFRFRFGLAKMVRATFDGKDRKLVIAIDVGTTFSGVAFWSVATWISNQLS